MVRSLSLVSQHPGMPKSPGQSVNHSGQPGLQQTDCGPQLFGGGGCPSSSLGSKSSRPEPHFRATRGEFEKLSG